MISAAFPYQKNRRRVFGREMAYVEVGEGDPIVLLHGNPTSSYLWRNVLPHLQPLGRCIAPDLIGMGDSDKLTDSGPGSYSFVEHRRYLEALLEALDVHERVTFVVHDWGSALGFDWARRHREALKGIAFMEAIVAPLGQDQWEKMGLRPAVEPLRSEKGDEMVLKNNYFIEEILPNAILRKLTAEEMAEYRRPFAEPGEGRRPTLTWPRQIPIAGEPPDVHGIATEYADWLGRSNVPKLFLRAEPGAILANDTLVNLVRGWPALTEKTIAGIHFVQEDSPDDIGKIIADWMGTIKMIVGDRRLASPEQTDHPRQPSTAEVDASKVAGNVYVLTSSGGNIGATGGNIGVSVGEDGVVMIDDQFASLAPEIRAALTQLSPKPVRFLINTHWHEDHTGGNAEFAETATILAHANVRKRLITGSKTPLPAFWRGPGVFSEFPPAGHKALPVVTFEQGISLWFNGEEIRVIHPGAGHTDGDSVIWFTTSNVVHMGDNYFARTFPFVDVANGGSVCGLIQSLNAIIDQIPADAKIIPGHGPVTGTDELHKYHDMLVGTVAEVKKGLDAGKTVGQMQREKILAPWADWGKGFIKQDLFITVIAEDLASR